MHQKAVISSVPIKKINKHPDFVVINTMKKANILVMYIAGAVLLVATILKSHQLLTEPILSEGFWESWEFFLIQIPLELGLAIWLLSGLFRKAAWIIATIAFAGFIAVTLQKALIGAESCGCFGTVHVNPWITLFAIDLPILLLLLVFRPVGCKLMPPPWPRPAHFFAVAIPTFILLPAMEIALIVNKPPMQTETYEVVDTAKWIAPKPTPLTTEINEPDLSVVPAEPTKEPNTESAAADVNNVEQTDPVIEDAQWPMLEHIDIAQDLRSGIWVVLLYHFDCPDCAEAIPAYDRLYRSIRANEDIIRFAFVHLPPFDDSGDAGPVPADTVCALGKIDTGKMFYVETPLVVVIENGTVLGVWEGHAPGLDEILNAAFGG